MLASFLTLVALPATSYAADDGFVDDYDDDDSDGTLYIGSIPAFKQKTLAAHSYLDYIIPVNEVSARGAPSHHNLRSFVPPCLPGK